MKVKTVRGRTRDGAVRRRSASGLRSWHQGRKCSATPTTTTTASARLASACCRGARSGSDRSRDLRRMRREGSGDRLKCLRCGEPLVARAKTDKAPPQARKPWVTIGIAAGCLAVGGFSIMLLGRASNRAVQVPARAAAPSTRAAGQSTADVSDSPHNSPDPVVASASDLLAGEKAYESGNLESALATPSGGRRRQPRRCARVE